MGYISIWVDGTPTAQPRPRATIREGHIHIYNKNTSKEWKKRIEIAFIPHADLMIDKPIKIGIAYYIKRPKSLMRKKDSLDGLPHTKKPDIDNLNKSVLDALTNIGLWVDDSLVFSLSASKYYTDKDNAKIGACIIIEY